MTTTSLIGIGVLIIAIMLGVAAIVISLKRRSK